MEELLNKLIEKGWLPRWYKNRMGIPRLSGIYFYQDENWKFPYIGQIVSRESWLWQFVCENGMIKKDTDIGKDMEKYMYKCEYTNWCWQTINYRKRSKFTNHYFYEYRVIESALCDEDKLEEFLLDNIKIDG